MTEESAEQFADKEEYIKKVFAAIAPVYDRMNRVLSLGMVQGWYRKLAGITEPRLGTQALDAGAGTGEIALLLARRVGSQGFVMGIDLSAEMLNIAREKFEKRKKREQLAPVSFVTGTILDLPFPDENFDVVTTGFTLRNVTDIVQAVKEMSRVCKKEGKVVCLEISRPSGFWGWVFGLYWARVVPFLGRITGHGERLQGKYPPYSWLSHSLRNFPQGEEMERIFQRCGLKEVETYPLFGGVAAIYKGIK